MAKNKEVTGQDYVDSIYDYYGIMYCGTLFNLKDNPTLARQLKDISLSNDNIEQISERPIEKIRIVRAVFGYTRLNGPKGNSVNLIELESRLSCRDLSLGLGSLEGDARIVGGFLRNRYNTARDKMRRYESSRRSLTSSPDDLLKECKRDYKKGRIFDNDENGDAALYPELLG